MMFETLIFLAAAAAAPSASPPAGCGPAPVESSPAVNPAIIEMTYDAFVAVEETPGLSEISRPAVADAPAGMVEFPAGTAWIS